VAQRPPTVRPFDERDLEAVASLLAARHRGDRETEPLLPERWERPDAARRFIETALGEARPEGVVAEREGRVVGYLFGTRHLDAPSSFDAQYQPPHSTSIPVWGHAVAEGEDALAAYAALYAPLAERWADAGFFTHRVHFTTGQRSISDAWVMLGFGAVYTFCVRDLALVDGEPPVGLEVHRAGLEDIEIVERFADLESAFHRQGPIFWPYVHGDVRPAVEAFHRQALSDDGSPTFIAYRDGQPVGMYLLVGLPGWGYSPLCAPEGSIYLYQAIVEGHARSGGAGTALLAHAVEWARARGLQHLTLHFASMNPSGGPFWLGHGFRPLEQALERRLDERIAWARPRE
jgi:GNAT superfamily N-acetyltransferase